MQASNWFGLRRPSTILLVAAITLLPVFLTAVANHSVTAPRPDLPETTKACALRSVSCPGSRVQVDRASFPSPFWTNATFGPAPSPRYGAAMAYDPNSMKMVLFGGGPGNYGMGDYAPRGDTWTYANGTWTNITAIVGSAPVPRIGATLVYDAREGYLVLIGGIGPGQNAICDSGCNDTWKFSDGHWSKLGTPWPYGLEYVNSGTGGLSAVFDTTDNFLLVQSSYLGGSTQGTSWRVEGSNWTDLSFNQSANVSSQSPNYYWPVMVDDPAADGVVLFGGNQFVGGTGNQWALSNSTWFFSHGHWANVTTNSTLTPPASDFASASYDPISKSVYLSVDGATWEWRGFQWLNITMSGGNPPPLQGASMAWDPQANASILFGGENGTHSSNATWEYGATPPLGNLRISATPNPVDAGAPVNFSATFIGGVSPVTISWDFGDGTNGTGKNTTHTYSVNGSIIEVSCVASDLAGDSTMTSLQLTVLSAPSARPFAAPNPTDVGRSTIFSPEVVVGGSSTFEWDFGDGSFSSAMMPNHVFGLPGNYTIILWINDSGGGKVHSAFNLLVDSVLSLPVLRANPSSPALGQLVNFSVSDKGGTSPYTYSWEFGDGTTGGNLPNISHIFTTDGPFTARVTVTDGAGETAFGSLNLSVALNLSILGDWSVGASPLPVAFTSRIAGGSPEFSYAWNFGDGSSSALADPTHTYLNAGAYQSVLRVTDGAGQFAEAEWSVFVTVGGGSIEVNLAANPSIISAGAYTVVTAALSGGRGGYVLRWTNGQVHCESLSTLSEECYVSNAGTFLLELGVNDQLGGSGVGVVEIHVGFGSTPANPPTGLDLASVNLSSVLIAASASLVLIPITLALLRRQGRAPRISRVEYELAGRPRGRPSVSDAALSHSQEEQEADSTKPESHLKDLV